MILLSRYFLFVSNLSDRQLRSKSIVASAWQIWTRVSKILTLYVTLLLMSHTVIIQLILSSISYWSALISTCSNEYIHWEILTPSAYVRFATIKLLTYTAVTTNGIFTYNMRLSTTDTLILKIKYKPFFQRKQPKKTVTMKEINWTKQSCQYS